MAVNVALLSLSSLRNGPLLLQTGRDCVKEQGGTQMGGDGVNGQESTRMGTNRLGGVVGAVNRSNRMVLSFFFSLESNR